MRCCANAIPPITVMTGSTSVTLERCGGCGDQQWLVAGQPVARERAFSTLAQAFQHSPVQARATRDRHATRTAARAAARVAVRTDVPSPEHPSGLSTLLAGWTVLGAPA